MSSHSDLNFNNLSNTAGKVGPYCLALRCVKR